MVEFCMLFGVWQPIFIDYGVNVWYNIHKAYIILCIGPLCGPALKFKATARSVPHGQCIIAAGYGAMFGLGECGFRFSGFCFTRKLPLPKKEVRLWTQ